jgi:hypothetical protein
VRKTGWRSDRELLDAVLGQDPYVKRTDATVEQFGFARVAFDKVAGYWRFPPMYFGGALTEANVLSCRAGTWRGRPMAVVVLFNIVGDGRSSTERTRKRAVSYRQVVAARLDVPPAARPWVAARPKWPKARRSPNSMHQENPVVSPGWFPMVTRGLRFPKPGGFTVPAPVEPEKWRIQADNTRFAGMLMAEVPWLLTDPLAGWQIDGLDVVHFQSVPVGAGWLDGNALTERLDHVCDTAETVERLVRLGYGDRPYSPNWPEESGVAERFPSDVVQTLQAAGWARGRGIPVEELLRRGTTEKANIRPFPAAETALREFGGLRVRHDPPSPDTPAGTFTLDPGLVPSKVIQRTHKRLFPLGMVDEPVLGERTFLVMGETTGHVYGLRDDDDILLGCTFEEAITKLVRGIFSPKTEHSLRKNR